ncbi:MAG: helix-turn-helix domain-containing protein [Bacillota bacterium]
MAKEWLTVKEAADRLGVARATIYKWAKQGRLPIYKLGERVARVQAGDLAHFLAEARPLYEAKKQNSGSTNVLLKKTKGVWADHPEIERVLGESKRFKTLSLNEIQKKAVLEAKKEIQKRFPLQKLIIFGSAARGEQKEGSDLDLLAITQKPVTHRDRNVIYGIIFETNYKYGTNLSIVTVDAPAWNEGLLALTPLYAEVERDGVPV